MNSEAVAESQGEGAGRPQTTGAYRRALLSAPVETPAAGTRIAAFLVRDRTVVERYSFAVAATVMASAGTLALAPHLQRAVFVLLWPAVLASALVGGVGPALVASALAVAVVKAWVFRTAGGGHLSPGDLPAMLFFLLASVAMSSIANALRVARARERDTLDELHRVARAMEEQAVELEQQLEESQAMQEELEQTTDELVDRTREAEAAGAFTRGIVESIADPFVVHDEHWRFVYINARAQAIFEQAGRAASGDLTGESLWDIYPDIVGTEHERQMRRAATERIPLTYEAFYEPSATWSVMACYPLPDGGLATQWKDVTARRRGEEAARYLARASEVLGASLDYETTLNDLARLVVPELAEWCTVHVLDADGEPEQVALAHVDSSKVEWAHELNRRYPPDPNAEQGTHAVVRTGAPLLLPDITDELLAAGAKDAEHLRIIRELGLRSAMIVPIAAHGRVLGALGLYSGRSGRRYGPADLELAGELARRAALAVDNALRHRAEHDARVVADEANGAKMQFLTVMSHELRTPLNAIGGYTELMQLGLRGPVTDAQQKDLARIASSQRSLLGLINDILNFAKVEAGHVEFHVGDVNVATLLHEVEDIVRPRLSDGALHFAIDVPDDALVMRGDAEKIRQVVLNLLTNAIKFTPREGSITVTGKAVGTMACIDVRDTGIGIPAERLSAVFDPFVQLGRTLSTLHEGTGLGLAISRDLARAMHGDITAASEPGRGSVFSLSLPLASPSQDQT